MNTRGPFHHALVLTNCNRLQIQKVKTQPLARGEIRVRPTIVGICGTDLQMVRGERSDAANIIGHEGIAEVIEIDPAALGDYELGQHVTINPTHPTNSDFLLGHTFDGLLQEKMVIPSPMVSAGAVINASKMNDRSKSVLIEPLAAVMYAEKLVADVFEHHSSKIQSLAVIGCGTIGSLIAERAAVLTDKKITIIHKSQTSMEWASAHENLKHLNNVHSDSLPILEHDQYDVVHIVTPRSGFEEALIIANNLIREGGVIDLFGGIPEKMDTTQLVGTSCQLVRHTHCCGQVAGHPWTNTTNSSGKSINLIGHRGASNGCMERAIAELNGTELLYQSTVTHRMSLKTVEQILNAGTQGSARKVSNNRWVKLAIDMTQRDENVRVLDNEYISAIDGEA